MRIRSLVRPAVAAGFASAALLGVAATPAAAAGPSGNIAAPSIAGCRDTAKALNGTDPNGHWPPYSATYTTTACADINVYTNQTVSVQTCFEPTSGGTYCNGWRTVYAGSWGLAATDVRDHTRFYLLFTSTGVTGRVAY